MAALKDEPQFAPIVVDGNELQRVSSAKLLGLTVSSNLTWNKNISDVIKKASKRLYFSVQLNFVKWPQSLYFYSISSVRVRVI